MYIYIERERERHIYIYTHIFTTPPECEAPVTRTHCEAHLRGPDGHAQLYFYITVSASGP